MKKRLAIIGAAGQAREVRWIAEELGYSFAGFVVSDRARSSPHDSPIAGELDWLERGEWDALALGIGSPGARVRVAEGLTRYPAECWPALIHPSAIIGAGSEVGHGALVGPRATLTVGVRLAPFCLVNSSVTIGHESRVGRGAVLNPGCNVSGGVEIGDGALVGTGAQVLQYLKVGARAQVGAGAVVTREVREDATVVGVPAREKTT